MDTQEILKALDIIVGDLTPEQLAKLENIAKKIRDPSKMSVQEALGIVNDLNLDIDTLQKNTRRKRAEEMEKNRKPKIGANDKCSCGSGLKFKKCCKFKSQTSS